MPNSIWGKSVKTNIIPEPSKDFEVFTITNAQLKSLLYRYGLKMPMGMLDGNYYFTNEAGWKTILNDLVQNSFLYKTDKYDCDKFAMKARVTAFERYGLNTCGFVIGDTPMGRHSWNIIVSDTGLLQFEPQYTLINFGVFKLGTGGYNADYILI